MGGTWAGRCVTGGLQEKCVGCVVVRESDFPREVHLHPHSTIDFFFLVGLLNAGEIMDKPPRSQALGGGRGRRDAIDGSWGSSAPTRRGEGGKLEKSQERHSQPHRKTAKPDLNRGAHLRNLIDKRRQLTISGPTEKLPNGRADWRLATLEARVCGLRRRGRSFLSVHLPSLSLSCPHAKSEKRTVGITELLCD